MEHYPCLFPETQKYYELFFFFFFNKNSVLLKVFKGGVSVFSFWSSDDWTARIEQPSALLSNLAFKKTHPGDCPAIRLMV